MRLLRPPAARTAGDALGVVRHATNGWRRSVGETHASSKKSVQFCPSSLEACAELQGLHSTVCYLRAPAMLELVSSFKLIFLIHYYRNINGDGHCNRL